MKKALAVLLALLMTAALLSACKDSPSTSSAPPSNSGSASNNPNNSSSPANSPVDPAPPSEPVTVTYITYQANERERVENAINAFMDQNKNITIDVVFYPSGDYSEILKTFLVSGDAPDLFQVWIDGYLDEYVKAGYVADITNTTGASKIFPGIKNILMESEARKGGIYALPEGLAGLGMIANMTVLKQAGVDAYPETYAAFVDACKKVQALGIQPIAFGDAEGVGTQLFSIWGADVVADNDTLTKLRSGEIKTLSDQPFMTTLYQRIGDLAPYFIEGWSGVTFGESSAMVGRGDAAFIAHGQWGLADVKAAASEGTEFIFGPLPLGDASKPLVAISGGISMSADAKDKDAAIIYLNFFASSEYFKYFMPTSPVCFEGVTVDLPKEDLAFQNTYAPYASSQSSVPNLGWADAMMRPLQEYLAGRSLADALAKSDEFFTAG